MSRGRHPCVKKVERAADRKRLFVVLKFKAARQVRRGGACRPDVGSASGRLGIVFAWHLLPCHRNP